ncbi:MAG TPA: ABC transporter permease, partial [Thermoanaerobaculia bacterium]|nr:ABC transporter permease [Thermoanaerobaculia bacterium]
AMFAGFHAWVTRPLDLDQPERLVAPYSTRPHQGEREHAVSARDAVDWRRESRGLEGLALFDRQTFGLDDEADPERIQGARIEAALFPLLGVDPVLGRGFSAEEDLPGQPAAVALIADSLWRRRFGGDPAVIGRDLRLDGRPHRIVGVMKPGFAFPEWAEVWTPLGLDPDAAARDRRVHDSVARLAPGVSHKQASEELRAVAARLAALYPETNRGWSTELLPLREKWLPPVVRTALAASLGASFFALLVICANVAGLLLAQANARAREMALRAALGAGRARLVRQTITECTVLAAAGGALGMPAAILLNHWVVSWAPIRPPYLFSVQVDAGAVAFAAIVTLVAGIACGLAPVARNAAAAVWETLAGGGRAGGAPGKQRLGAILVVAELALSTALGIGTLLLAKSFLEQRLADRGYRVRDVVSLRLDLGALGYREPGERVTFVERALERIAALPEVESAGATSRLPAGQGFAEARLEVEGVAVEAGEEPVVAAQWVTPGYFDALAIPRLDGRGFTAGEMRDGAGVAIVSASLAQRLWPGQSPLGRRLRPLGTEPESWLRVIGTVGDTVPVESMVASGMPARLQIYRPWSTAPAARLTVVVHARARAGRVVDAVRDSMRQVDPGVVVEETLTMADAVDRDQWVSRVFSQLLGLYASIAVAIALVGVYGLAADATSRRTHELAVRMALGARRRQVVSLVMRQGLVLGSVGIAAGILLAFALTRFGSAMLPGMSARDPVVFSGVALLLAAVTLLAIWLPARGVTRIEPAAALRSE